MNDKISIIVPVYNMEKYLDACVESLVRQEHENIEILLVDDGGSDHSPAMCDAWAERDARIRVFHKKNGGQGSARNLALDHISGDYISFIDSDDLVTADMYINLLETAQAYHADLVVCGTRSFDDGEKRHIPNSDENEVVIMTSWQAMENRMTSGKYISDSPCNKLYAAELFRNTRFVEGRLLEDSATMYKIIDASKKVVYSSKVGYLIRKNVASVSRIKYNTRRCDTIKTYEEMVSFMQERPCYEDFVPNSILMANGAVFYNAGELYSSGLKDEAAQDLIQKHARKQLHDYPIPSIKNKILLHMVAYAFPIYGMIYKYGKKGK